MKIDELFIAGHKLFELIKNYLFNSLNIFIYENDRLSLKPLAATFLIAVIIFLFSKGRKGKISLTKLLKFVFPKAIFQHPSFLMDTKIFLIRLIFDPTKLFTISFFSGSLAILVFNFLQGSLPSFSGKIPSTQINLFLISLVGFLIYDFSLFFLHFLFHKIPVLWPFHSVHHSAEVLNPLTSKRDHFIYNISELVFPGLFLGIGQGILIWAGDLYLNPIQILKINIYINTLNYLAGNLHHSHIWISFGFLDRIFVSPAIHQLHHSVDLKHRNKNFGLLLSIWDQLFGTIYVPKEKEDLIFGLDKGVKNPHDTLLKFYFLPFQESALILKRKIKSLFERKDDKRKNLEGVRI